MTGSVIFSNNCLIVTQKHIDERAGTGSVEGDAERRCFEEEQAKLDRERGELERLKSEIERKQQEVQSHQVSSTPQRPYQTHLPAPSDFNEIARDGVYIAYANGVVRDTSTGLEWVAGPDREITWVQARSWAENLNVAGGGWRMPTMHELQWLYRKGSGRRNMTQLLKTSGWFIWSGEARGSSSGWGLSLSDSKRWGDRRGSQDVRAFAVRSRGSG